MAFDPNHTTIVDAIALVARAARKLTFTIAGGDPSVKLAEHIAEAMDRAGRDIRLGLEAIAEVIAEPKR